MLTLLLLSGVPIWQALPVATGFYLALIAMVEARHD
jgi:hypothetical protein